MGNCKVHGSATRGNPDELFSIYSQLAITPFVNKIIWMAQAGPTLCKCVSWTPECGTKGGTRTRITFPPFLAPAASLHCLLIEIKPVKGIRRRRMQMRSCFFKGSDQIRWNLPSLVPASPFLIKRSRCFTIIPLSANSKKYRG